MAVKELDCLSELCPIPLLRAMKEFKNMNPGDILIVHTDHSCAAVDMKKWADKKSFPIKSVESDCGEWEIYIQKPEDIKK